MKLLKYSMYMMFIVSVVLLLTGCPELFQLLIQPGTICINATIFSVQIEVSFVNETDSKAPWFGVNLPQGWSIVGNSVTFSGDENGEIVYNAGFSAELENEWPSEPGYYWWGGATQILVDESGTVSGTLQIQIDQKTGVFSLEYRIGEVDWPSLENPSSNDDKIEQIIIADCKTQVSGWVFGGSLADLVQQAGVEVKPGVPWSPGYMPPTDVGVDINVGDPFSTYPKQLLPNFAQQSTQSMNATRKANSLAGKSDAQRDRGYIEQFTSLPADVQEEVLACVSPWVEIAGRSYGAILQDIQQLDDGPIQEITDCVKEALPGE